MLAWTWLTWPDAFYDFGSQLYFPWQITQGKRLYADVAYFNGPLPQYLNAAAFMVAGVSLRTLVWLNCLILAATISVFYRMFARLSDRVTATVGCLFALLVFAFGQYVGIGNYNWLCPYTHEVTHGVALSLAALAAMGRFLRTNRMRWLIITGALLGLVFLTKAEIYIPAAAAIGIGAMFAPRRVRALAIVAGAMIAPIAIAFALLCITIPPATAARAIAGSWPWLFDRRIAQLAFYRQGLGIDNVRGNVMLGLASLCIYAVPILFVLSAAAAWARSRWLACLLIGICAAAIVYEWPAVVTHLARPWPLFVAIIAVVALRRADGAHGPFPSSGTPGEGRGEGDLRARGALENSNHPHPNPLPAYRERGPYDDTNAWRLRAMLAIFSLGLLGKMLLNARIAQYGFALALPAAMLLIDAAVGWLPRRSTFARGATIAIIAAIAAVHLWATHLMIANKTVLVGDGADQFYAGPRGLEVKLACQAIESTVGPAQTLAVMPQGLMLNYVARRTNPLPAPNLMPPELSTYGEERLLAALNSSPPDFIVLTLKDVGTNGFILTEGRYEYGQRVLAWVRAHYDVLGMTNYPPGYRPELGLQFLKRR
jgi:hypothetical protein